MTGRHRGERWALVRTAVDFGHAIAAGDVSDSEISEVEGKLAVTAGTCAVMGTASTMACIAEALGLILPGTAAIPAVHADRLRARKRLARRPFALWDHSAGRKQSSMPSRLKTRFAFCWRSVVRPMR